MVYAVFLVLACIFTWPLTRDLSHQLRRHEDPRFLTWVQAQVSRRVFEDPAHFFDANAFYPHGHTLAYSELLLLPAVLGFAPIYALSRNPVLAYNVTLLLGSALSGWAAYHAGRRLTGERLGGWVAGIVFCLSPFRTGYYGIATMQFSFAVPLAFLAFTRFLESRRLRSLFAALVLLWCQAVSVWYFGIMLSLLLAGLLLGVLLLRPERWPPRTIAGALLGGLGLALALTPAAWPYVVTRAELGFERTLTDAARFSADVLSFLDPGPAHRFYRLVDSGRYPGLFPGFTTLGLASVALLWLTVPAGGPPMSGAARWLRRLLFCALVLVVGAIALVLATGGVRLRALGLTARMTDLGRPVAVLLGLGVTALALRGWAWARGPRDRPLRAGDWVLLLGVLAVLFGVLALGPVMRIGNREVGRGLYGVLYDLWPPLRAMRIPLRIGFLWVFLVGLLAAFGVAWLRARLNSGCPRPAAAALAALPVLLLLEYLPAGLAYETIPWDRPPPAYQWLADQPSDFAVVEWPSGRKDLDTTYMLWSLFHGKRLVHGWSGFTPPFTHEVLAAVAALPAPEAVARLRSVYPLRFILVHLDRLAEWERGRWRDWEGTPPAGLHVAGRFGETLAFAVAEGAEAARVWERTFSSTRVATHPRARFTLALGQDDPTIEHTVAVTFNGRLLARFRPAVTPTPVELRLPGPYPAARRNVLRVEHHYRIAGSTAGDARYRVGATGVVSPVDVVVASAGRLYGNRASIRVNGEEVAPNRRGYNVAVVDPRAGVVTAAAVFDTFIAATEAERLARFLGAVPPGFIVAAAVKDDAQGRLTPEAVEALRAVGGQFDARGQAFTSHLLVGVKGARPGSAIESAGPRGLTALVGVDRTEAPLVLDGFRLEPDGGEGRGPVVLGFVPVATAGERLP